MKVSIWLSRFKLFNKNDGIGHSFIWQGIQLGGLFLFLGFLISSDSRITHMMVSDQNTTLKKSVAVFLDNMLWPLLPGGFWLWVWPLLLITVGLLCFTTWRWWFFGLSGIASVLMLMADRIYFLFFDSVVPISSVGATGQLWRVKDSVFAALKWTDLLWLGACFLFPLIGWVIHRGISPKLGQNRTFFLTDKFLGMFFLILTFHAASQAFFLQSKFVVVESEFSIKVYADRSQAQKMSFVVPYQSSYKNFAAVFGVFNFHLYNFFESFNEEVIGEPLSEENLPRVVEFLDKHKELNDRTSPLEGVAKGRNVFVFSMESFATAIIGLEIDGQEVTPVMNKLAEEHLYWPLIMDNARTGGTSDAEFSVLTGLLTDLRRMAAMGIAERTSLLGLPKSLKEAGYSTYSFHGNEASFWNRNVNHPRLGIDQMKFEGAYSGSQSVGIGIPDHVVFPEVLDIVQRGTSPYFGFVISLTSHFPFPNISKEFHDLRIESLKSTPFSRYLKVANYTDRALGQFIEKAKETGQWENSILVLYGDHRPPLPDHEMAIFEEVSGIPLRKGRGLQIPLVVVMPGLEAEMAPIRQQALETVGGLQDIFPTVMHLIGESVPYGLYGTHLFVPNAERRSLPLFKLASSYVNDGVVYTASNGDAVFDDFGLLFTKHRDTLVTDPKEKQANLEQAANALEMHLYIFNQNAQKEAIDFRAENPR